MAVGARPPECLQICLVYTQAETQSPQQNTGEDGGATEFIGRPVRYVSEINIIALSTVLVFIVSDQLGTYLNRHDL